MSVRELLLLVACCAVACVSLKFAGSAFWIGVASIGMLVFMAAAAVAMVDRGRRQAFAIGFVLWVSIYGFLLQLSGAAEMDPYEGRLPTSRAMLPLFQTVVVNRWIDPMTGQEIPNYDPSVNAGASPGNSSLGSSSSAGGGFGIAFGFGGGGFGGFGGGGNVPSLAESPERSAFMSIAHVWWAVVLGYVGGRFARWVYARRPIPIEAANSSKNHAQDVT